MPRKNVFLDLDNTILFSESLDISDAMSNAINYDHDFLNDYVVAARPRLQMFLDYLFANHNVSIWTAATKLYATYMYARFIKKYDRRRRIRLLLHSQHCEESKKVTGKPKSLSMLWNVWKVPGFTEGNTIIIDDLEEVCSNQKNNCILVKPFYATDTDDTELLDVTRKLATK